MSRKQYLGDGCYVDFDGYALVLTTSDGRRDTNTVVLEPEVYGALCQYVERLKATGAEVVRELWVEEYPNGAIKRLSDKRRDMEGNIHPSYRVVRYVPADTARGWVSVEERLPDSDVHVALVHEKHGWPSLTFGVLEFSDDSEGHGQPYWVTMNGPGTIDAATHWMPLTLPAPPTETTDE